VSRQTDIFASVGAQRLAGIPPAPTELPALDWSSIGQTAPRVIETGPRAPSDPLPKADVVIVTWTNAEWSALDHVFVNSGSPRSNPNPGTWARGWNACSNDTDGYASDERSDPLWGTFRQVVVQAASGPLNVILFRSNAHLAHPPYIGGLRAMVATIVNDANPKRLYSIGTAGGAALEQALGDAVVTNSAELLAGSGPNVRDPANGETFRSPGPYPPTNFFLQAQSLMLKLGGVGNQSDLSSLFVKLKETTGVGNLSLADLINAPLQPENLCWPEALVTHTQLG
jgi:hypothetical protein